MIYLIGQLLPVLMIGGGTILILIGGNEGDSGFAIAGTILVSSAFLGINQSVQRGLNQKPDAN